MFWEILLAVLTVAGYFIWTHFKQEREFDEMTKVFNIDLKELRKYNGVGNKRVFLCVKGDLFEVTGSPFYSPGGGYHLFAGRESSVSLAKGDLEGTYLDKLPPYDLNAEEEQALDEWHSKFLEKYRKVGKLKIN
jgi:membrane-associated progesterone receptor component